MKIIPPNGCVCVAYYDSELLFLMGENWDAKNDLEAAIADNTSFEFVEITDFQNFEANDGQATIYFEARFEVHDEPTKEALELTWKTLY